MRKLLPLAILTLALGATAVEARFRGDPEEALAKAIEGRVAGEPVDCIDLHRVRSSRVIPGTAIVYDAGGVIYVNRPRNGADELNQWDAMVTRTPTTRLCSVDVVELVDQATQTMTGVVFLGDFVPYRRVRTGSAD